MGVFSVFDPESQPFLPVIASSSPINDPSVLVVGGGPAGATAARTLARAGARVTLLDRATFPRNKPCGGGISIRVLRRFPYLGTALSRIATHAISRLYLEGPDGQSTVIESDAPAALMIRRVEFDALLVSLAVEAGATLVSGADVVQAREDGDRVVLTTRDGRRFEAPFVVAADGVHSVLARRLGLNRGWPAASIALDMMEETPRAALRDVDPSTLWVAYGYPPDFTRERPVLDAREHHRASASASGCSGGGGAPREISKGYAYIFPKRDHVNVGIGYLLSYYREQVGDAPYDLQRALVTALRARGVIVGESVRQNFTPSLIPVGGPLRRPGRGRVLLAGDAGGFVNAFTAEGIYYAMVSGDLSARVILRSTGSVERLADRHRRACDDEIGAELRDSVLIQRYLFADRRRITRIVSRAHREPAISRLILDLVAGRRGYREVRRGCLARAPLRAGRLGWEYVSRLAKRRA
jgi:flavin-dependent dehydrogenase